MAKTPSKKAPAKKPAPKPKAKAPSQKPSVGRTVHFLQAKPKQAKVELEPKAAIVTAVHSDACVNLVVFNDTSIAHRLSVQYGDKANCWAWPPRI